MKGSNGKKKRSKQAFELKQAYKKRQKREASYLKKLAKYQIKNEAREREREENLVNEIISVLLNKKGLLF